jgi:sugar phosphate isomerase/epimerase
MILGIAGYTLGKTHTLPQILSKFKQYEARWVELWPWNLEGGNPNLIAWEDRYEDRDINQCEQVLNEYGIGVACVTFPAAFSPELVARPEEYLKALEKAIDAAKALNSKFVNSYCYHFALGQGVSIDPFVRLMQRAAKYAEESGVTLLLENEAHDATGTVSGMLKILDAVNSKACKTTFDPVNYYQANDEGYPDAYERLKKYIVYVHVKGGCLYNPGLHSEKAKGGTLTGRIQNGFIYYPPLPDSAVNTDRLLSRLTEDQYEGIVMIEPHVTPDLADEYYAIETKYLRKRGVH